MQNIIEKPQLFCFTHAGGTSSFFDEIEPELYGLSLVKLEYSGHGKRHKEPLYKSFFEMSNDLLSIIRSEYHGGAYGLFGYSMGSIALVETLMRIIETGMELPTYVFIAAHEPCSRKELSGIPTENIDDWVKQRTLEFGAVPDELVANRTFWKLYLPIFKSDYKIISDYDFDNIHINAPVNATIFYSEKDTPYCKMSRWSEYFNDEFDMYEFDGPHFFIHQHYKEMAHIIMNKMCIND